MFPTWVGIYFLFGIHALLGALRHNSYLYAPDSPLISSSNLLKYSSVLGGDNSGGMFILGLVKTYNCANAGHLRAALLLRGSIILGDFEVFMDLCGKGYKQIVFNWVMKCMKNIRYCKRQNKWWGLYDKRLEGQIRG